MTGYGDWHLGIYGYQRGALESYPNLIGTREERIEQLEQLRWLKNGWDIGVLPVTFSGIEINTPEDAERWNETE
jgi:3-deoxy-manno-octulosonate cytidylyltransferase (CMP-KDO synthetase)